MPFLSSALTSDQLTKLRGNDSTPAKYAGDLRVFIWPNTVVFAARVDGAYTGSASFGFVSFDTVTTGAYTDVKQGMTVYIAASNDIKSAYFVGRVRKTPLSGTLYINESAVPIADNDYIFVTEDRREWEKLPYINLGTTSKDFDISFRQLPPYFTTLDSIYITEVTSGVGTFTLDGTAAAATTGATISTYLWAVGDCTITVGSTSTASITITAPQGKRYVTCTATDSGSRTTTIAIPVVVNGPDYPATHTIDSVQVTCSSGVWSASISPFDGIEDILPGSLVAIYDASETYNGTAGNLITGNNVRFVGRMRPESTSTQGDGTFAAVSQARIEIEGAAAILSRLPTVSIAMTNNSSPDEWDEINDWTPWRGIVHLLREHSTFLELHSISFVDTTSNTEAAGSTAQGDLFSACAALAQSVQGVLDFSPQGSIKVVKHGCLLSDSDRTSLTTIAGWTDGSSSTHSDLLSYSIEFDPIDKVGRLEAFGGSYNTTTTQITPVRSMAPGNAFGNGLGQSRMTDQILDRNLSKSAAQTEINRRSGEQFALENANTRLSIQHPDGYHWLTPSHNQWYTFVIAATENTRGKAYTSSQRWLLDSITVNYDNANGTRQVSATYLLETNGYPGITVNPPATTEETTDPYQPPDEIYPLGEDPGWIDDGADDPIPVDDEPKGDGNTVFFGSTTEAFLTNQFITGGGSPECNDVTPTLDSGETIVAGVLNQLNKEAYILTNKSDTSRVHYTSNVNATGIEWGASDYFAGLYEVIRCAGDEIAVYGDNVEESIPCDESDFEVGQCNWYLKPHAEEPVFDVGNADRDWEGGEYEEGVGWNSTSEFFDFTGSSDATGLCVSIKGILDSEYDIPTITIEYTVNTVTTVDFTVDIARQRADNSWVTTNVQLDTDSTTGAKTLTTGGDLGNFKAIALNFKRAPTVSAPTGSITITKVTLNGGCTVVDAGTNTPKARMRTSSDGGETFGASVLVGDAVTNGGGFDLDRPGAVSLAAASGQVRIATTFGGAYGDESNGTLSGGDPVMIISPYYQWGSTSTKNYPDTTPHYLLASNALVSSEALWIVKDSGRTAVTPSISGTKALGIGPNLGTGYYGTKWAVVMSVSGTRYLFITQNIDAGPAVWANVAVGANCSAIRVRRGGSSQLYIGDGTSIKFSKGFLVTDIETKATPATGNIIWLDIKG